MRLLDLFCGAGGSAVGYHRAGFEVVGVDINPQPRYPFQFFQSDARIFLRWANLNNIDAIHASPPCQAYANVTAWRGDPNDHPDLIADTRLRLMASNKPWVMENVPEAPVRPDFLLCGSQFGLAVRRHRAFETSPRLFSLLSPCHHKDLLPFMHKGERAYADAMGCDWMTNREAREAIPPAFTQHIGEQLMAALTTAVAS
jgi:C-5 cytosine-specific DNA methylase